MKKTAIISFIVGFVAGVFTFALYTYRNSNVPIFSKVVNIVTGQEPDKITDDPNHTYVTYDGNDFKPSRVIMPLNGYIYITNNSKEKYMHLESDHPYLGTPRRYGESEQVKARINNTGNFIVRDKLNSKATLEVTIQ